MIKNYQHRRHNKNLLMVHIIIVTKYRKQLLTGELDHDIKRYIMEVCMRNHWYIKRMQSDKDHIHILLQYNPTDSITTIVSSVNDPDPKGIEASTELIVVKYFFSACHIVFIV